MMRYDTIPNRLDLLVRGVFVLVVLIGGVVDRLQLNTALQPASAGAPVAAANIGAMLPASPACRPAHGSDLATQGDSGQRHVFSGSVRSSAGYMPIGGAKIEFWPAGPDAASNRAGRAMLFADADGKYQLQCDLPASGRGYVYLRVSADGYTTLTTQYRAISNQAENDFEIVLQPRK